MMREVTLEELYRDLSYEAGKPIKFTRLRPDPAYTDPIEPLTRPLSQYDGRVFWYAGLLYGFCRLDMSVSERFRSDTQQDITVYKHICQHPLCTIPWFPQFVETKVSRLLQSCPIGTAQQHLFKFLTEQIIIDRQRQRVWRVKLQPMDINDPYVREHDKRIVKHTIYVFVPYRHDITFQIVPGPVPQDPPQIEKAPHADPEFQQETERFLRNT